MARAHLIPQAELDRVAASVHRAGRCEGKPGCRTSSTAQAWSAGAYKRWLERNVFGHRLERLSRRRPVAEALGHGSWRRDLTRRWTQQRRPGRSIQPERIARQPRPEPAPALGARGYSAGALSRRCQGQAGLATPNIGLLTDMIACPGGDFCALANARSIPVAAAITERFDDLDELYDIGDIDLHISGCINSCGHHHSGHIGILGVDKDGSEWYQITLGGSDGSTLSGNAQIGKVIGPSFAADEVPDDRVGRCRHHPPAPCRQREVHRHHPPHRHRALQGPRHDAVRTLTGQATVAARGN